MKLQWMKDILGDAYTDEMDAKVSAALGERFVARADFNEKTGKVKELETQVTQLNEGIKTRDKQLEDLKKSAGDNEELTKQIETLTQQNKDAKANYDKELAKVKLMAAVDAELTAAGSKNNTAVRAVLAEFLEGAKIVDGKVTATVGGETITLANKVEALKKDAATDFMFGTAAKREVYIAQDSSHINQWGVLQYYEKLDSNGNAKAMADALLDLYNTKTRTLRLKDVLGDIRVRAGTLLVVMLGLGDINVSNYLMVEQCKHTFKDGMHLMELKMRGGTFVT